MFIISVKIHLFLLWGVCLFTFLPGMFQSNGKFMLDDQVAILNNMDVVNISRPLFDSLGLIVQHDFWGQDLFHKHSHKSYRPLVTMLYHLEFRSYNDLGDIASTMRANNLIMHYVVCVAMIWVFTRIMPELHRSFSMIAVLLFAVHPIHTEVIYHIVGRADIFCALIFLISVHHYCEIMTGEFCYYVTHLKPNIPSILDLHFQLLFFIIIISAKEFGNKNDSDGAFWSDVHAFEGNWDHTSGKFHTLSIESITLKLFSVKLLSRQLLANHNTALSYTNWNHFHLFNFSHFVQCSILSMRLNLIHEVVCPEDVWEYLECSLLDLI